MSHTLTQDTKSHSSRAAAVRSAVAGRLRCCGGSGPWRMKVEHPEGCKGFGGQCGGGGGKHRHPRE